MPTLAVKIFDPAGQEWAQLLDADERIRRLVPVIVERLDLPEDLHYELLERREDRVLHPEDTLPEAGIRGGEELLLRPVEDSILAAFLDALYDEAIGFAAGKTFDAALNRLETLYRLDPEYPDREGLWRKVARNGGKAPSPSSSGRSGRRSGSRAPGAGAASSGAASLSSAGRAGGARAGSAGGGCLLRIVAIVIVAVIGIWATGVWDRIDRSTWPPPFGPGTSGTTTVDGVTVGDGDVRVTLQWDSAADVDLHVFDPAGTEIYYGARLAPSGGELDVDANAGCSGDRPVENVFWATGEAPSGPYRVEVNFFGACGTTGPTAYTVTAYADGREVQRRSGQIGPGDRVEAFQFSR